MRGRLRTMHKNYSPGKVDITVHPARFGRPLVPGGAQERGLGLGMVVRLGRQQDRDTD